MTGAFAEGEIQVYGKNTLITKHIGHRPAAFFTDPAGPPQPHRKSATFASIVSIESGRSGGAP
jgi:hypothetical protein